MIRKILKAIGWVAGGLISLVIVAYLVTLAINLRDRQPSATALRLESAYRERPALADEANAFVAMTTFNEDSKRDHPEFREKRDPAVREFVGCRAGNPECVASFDAGEKVFEQWMASESWLLDRYRALIALAGWREDVPKDYTQVIPSYSLIMDGQKLLLLKAKVLARKGEHAQVKALLEADLRFWRMVLQSSDLLITRMIATAALNRHFEVGNLVLRDLRAASATSAVPDGWRQPLSDAERSMRRSLIGEWILVAGSMRKMADEPFTQDDPLLTRAYSSMGVPLFQVQASLNVSAEHYLRVAQILDAPLERYEAAAQEAEDFAIRIKDESYPPRSPYNFLGQMMLGAARPDFARYGRRVNDIEGVRRAALVAVALREANIRPEDVAAALPTAPLRNPYNDRPFTWHEKNKAILFEGLETSERGTHYLYY